MSGHARNPCINLGPYPNVLDGVQRCFQTVIVWQGVVQSLLPLAGCVAALWGWHRRTGDEGGLLSPLGLPGLISFGAFSLLIWVVPTGALLVFPALLGLSMVSPASRISWNEERVPRLLAIGVALVCFCAGGTLPVEEPVAPEPWGTPLFTENSNAPAYPASEQFTWVTNDVVILQSISMRLPHQPGAWGAEGGALWLSSTFGMEVDRMHQAIALLDEEVPFVRLLPEEILLVNVMAPPTLDVRWGAAQEATVEFRRYDVRSTAFGVDAEGTKVGEVVVAAKSNWGGQLDLLVIVRPVAHPTIANDANGALYIGEWLAAR